MESISLDFPDWIDEFMKRASIMDFSSPERRMALAIELSALNVEKGTGGPFGAAVFTVESQKLVSVGVNVVIPNGLSIAHAEVLALSAAQRKMGSWDLWPHDLELVSSSQPCAMCIGAIWWSGPRRLLVGARTEDVETLAGFSEGPIAPDSFARLEAKGTRIVRDILREEACAVLRRYAEAGGAAYNASSG